MKTSTCRWTRARRRSISRSATIRIRYFSKARADLALAMSFFSNQLSHYFLQSILLALVLGSLVGIERQWNRRLVDLKTNALVAMGAALFMLLSKTPQGFVEPIQMAAQIVVGVGFLAGGIMFRDSRQAQGLNTAATLWCSAAVGAMCGMNRWFDASVASIAIVLANSLLGRVAQYLNKQMGIADNLTDSVQFQWVCSASDALVVHEKMTEMSRNSLWEMQEVRLERHGVDNTLLSITALFEQGESDKGALSIQQATAGWPAFNFSWRKL
ncbi:MgtC/SapB family protein [Limnohabitans planktonicus]|nr:MgtC/SapB family protein [Limnohabitans planktonicus]